MLMYEYELLYLRTLDKDIQMWDAPALAIAAEAFLFTIALDAGVSDAARLVASALTVVVAGISMQLMAKHRFFLRLDTYRLRLLEDLLAGNGECHPGSERLSLAQRGWAFKPPVAPGAPWSYLLEEEINRTLVARVGSYLVWQVGLGVMGTAGAAIFALTWVVPGLFR